MKTTRMYCENCGKEFYSEYYEGGYIDHMNMTSNFECYLHRGIESIVEVITQDDNDYRELKDIDDRLKCFLIWLEKKKVSKEMLEEIKEKVAEKKKYIENLLQIRKEIQDKIDSLDVAILEQERDELEQENKELKEELKSYKYLDVVTLLTNWRTGELDRVHNKIANERDVYRSALEEIRDIIRNKLPSLSDRVDVLDFENILFKVFDKINEVLGENTES